MRLVLDTNVVIAGMLWQGPPRDLLEAALKGTVSLATSAALIEELARSLRYAKLAERISRLGLSAGSIVARYALISDAFLPAAITPSLRQGAKRPRRRPGSRLRPCRQGRSHRLGRLSPAQSKELSGITIVRPAEALKRVAV